MKKISALLLGISLIGASIGVGATLVTSTEYREVDAYRDTIATCNVENVLGDGQYYQAYSNEDWLVTSGDNYSIGCSSDSLSTCNLSNYSKYAVDYYVTSTDTAIAIASLKSLSDVGQVSFHYNAGNGLPDSTIYVHYSSDNTTFESLLVDKTSTSYQGSKIDTTTNTNTFTFDQTYSGYFAVILKFSGTSGAWRFDYPLVTFESAAIPEVSLDQTYIYGDVGDTLYLQASYKDFSGTPTFGWDIDVIQYITVAGEASDSSICEIKLEQNVNVPATITVTASYYDETATATCQVMSYNKPTSVTIADSSGASSGTAVINDTLTLTAEVYPDTAREATFSSSDDTIATVDENGVVTAVSAGTAKIRASSSNETIYAEYALTVEEKNITYELVTSTDDLVLGNAYTIGHIGTDGASSYAITTNQQDTRRTGSKVTIADNKFTVNDGGNTVANFILVAGLQSGTYAFYDKVNGGYIYASGNGDQNGMKTESTLSLNSSFKITLYSDGVLTAIAQGENTSNMIFFDTNSSYFSCTATGWTTSKVGLYIDRESGNEGTANAWATTFLEESGKVCVQDADLENPNDLMGLESLSIDTLPVYAQDILKYATSENASGDLANALARYDHIVNKYTSCTDVLGRRETAPAYGLFNLGGDNEANFNVGVVIAVSLLGLLAFAGTKFVMAKRKQ